MQNKITAWCNNQRFTSIIMTLAGALIWFLSDIRTSSSMDMVNGIGVFLFVYGAASQYSSCGLNALTRKQRIIKISSAFIAGLLIAVGLALLAGRG